MQYVSQTMTRGQRVGAAQSLCTLMHGIVFVKQLEQETDQFIAAVDLPGNYF